MKRSWRFVILASLLATLTCGCASFWHDLQPHRLRRLNSGPAPSLDPEFTQSDKPVKAQLVRLEGKSAALTANRAEVSLAR